MSNAISWDDLRLFLDVARLGGLSAAVRTTGLSAATLGRRVTALETQVGQPLFVRRQTGYELTRAGEDLLERAAEVERAMLGVSRWRDGQAGDTVVRVSAGTWTAAFLSAHIGDIWRPDEGTRIELVTANLKVDIGRRAADIGIRAARPTEPYLAGRRIGQVAYAIYVARRAAARADLAPFVGVAGDAATLASARWVEAHHGSRIRLVGSDGYAVREMVATGAGLAVFPCFAGDGDPRLVRVGEPIDSLAMEQWLVTHHQERHRPEIRRTATRIAALMKAHARLFRGEVPRGG